MAIPQISLPVAFAIGLPVGIAGFLGQELLLRRRRRRRTARTESWGPRRRPIPPPTRTPAAEPAAVTAPPAAPAAPAVAAASAPPPAARPTRRPVTRTTPKAAAKPKPAAVADAAEARKRAAAVAQLQKREAYLEASLDLLVAFVDGAARRPRAEKAAASVAELVPKARQPAELKAFLKQVEGGEIGPTALQDAATNAGVKLAQELKAVKGELDQLPE